MASPTRSRPVRPWAGALLALLVAGWLAPSVRAGCVHDALRRSQEPAGAAHFRWLIAAGAMTAAADSSATDPSPSDRDVPGQPRPCDGPSCSGHSGLPTAPSASIAPTAPSWAWPGSRAAILGPGSDRLPLCEARPVPVHRGPTIFHPPRPTFA